MLTSAKQPIAMEATDSYDKLDALEWREVICTNSCSLNEKSLSTPSVKFNNTSPRYNGLNG
ncbi:hypothetical protein O9993_21355 [Vibrio lentus]|nr:hypothetical protein [Vibrio lentus]